MRAAIFIDGGYILSQLKQYKLSPDYEGFTDYFLRPLREAAQVDLLRVYFYYCAPWMSDEPTEDELRRKEAYDEFIEEITSLPRWQVRLGKLEKRWDRNREYYEQKRVDVLLTVDMVRHAAAGHIQHAILIAGDSDFIPAVQATKEFGVTLSLWSGDFNTVHNDLLAWADESHTMVWDTFPAKNSPSGGSGRRSVKKKTTKRTARSTARGTTSRRKSGGSRSGAEAEDGSSSQGSSQGGGSANKKRTASRRRPRRPRKATGQAQNTGQRAPRPSDDSLANRLKNRFKELMK